MSFYVNLWYHRYSETKPLLKKINKVEVIIKNYHITYGISHKFNPEGQRISGLYVEQNLKVTILQMFFCGIIKI